MINYIKLILKLASNASSIIDRKLAQKYQKELLKLEKSYDEEFDKNKPDRNVLDHIERDILRIGNIINTEIERKKANNLQR